MFTASHNPAQYNGIKLCRADAVPIGAETGLAEIRDRVATASHAGRASAAAPSPSATCSPTTPTTCSAWRPVTGRRLQGRGRRRQRHGRATRRRRCSAGSTSTWCRCTSSSTARFPNHEANPIEPGEPASTCRPRCSQSGADIGLAFDGDADRCFVVDEHGELVSPASLTALIAARELAKHPGATVIHNLITSRAVPEIVARARRPPGPHPGRPLLHQGRRWPRPDAVFGGEHSGHFYFRDFWRADSGHARRAARAGGARRDRRAAVASCSRRTRRYVATGEINSTVADQAAVLRRLEADVRRPRRRRRWTTSTG